MAVNRYNRAVDIPIMNTYVPINFDLLYRIGKEQGDIVRLLADLMTEAIQKFGEFSSISDLDVLDYYNSSTGKLAGLINEAAANPDKLKDAAWRSKFQLGLNSIDYNHLANLRKSAENMDTREKAKAALRAQGLYADWFDDPRYSDLRNWSTRDSGVMTNVAPDKYISMQQLGSDYVKDLKPTFYKGKAPNSGASMPYTNWMAISREDVRRSLDDHADDILSTTAGQRHFERFARMYRALDPSAPLEQIRESFIDALTTEQSDKMIETPVIDQASLSLALQASKNAAYAARRNGTGKSSTPAKGLSWFTNVYNQLMRDTAFKANTAKNMNPTLEQEIKNSDMASAKAIRDMYVKFVNDPTTSRAMGVQLKQLVDNGYVNKKDLQNDNIGLDLIQAMMMGASQTLNNSNPLKQQYVELQNNIIKNTLDQTDKLASELALSTFRAYNNTANNKNPLVDAFTKVSSNILRASDDALLSAFGDPQLEKPALNVILNELFGTDAEGKHMLEFDDYKNARSSFDFLYNNYSTFQNEADAALKQVGNYTKKGVDGKPSLIGHVDPFGWGDLDTYSVRNSLAAGEYGKCEITGIRGFTKVNGQDPDEYAFQVIVKVPIERIREHMDTVADIDLDELWDQEGLRGMEIDEESLNEKGKKVSAKKEYVEVPMVINKKIAGRNAYALDAMFNKSTNTTAKTRTASEQQAVTYDDLNNWIYLNGQ